MLSTLAGCFAEPRGEFAVYALQVAYRLVESATRCTAGCATLTFLRAERACRRILQLSLKPWTPTP